MATADEGPRKTPVTTPAPAEDQALDPIYGSYGEEDVAPHERPHGLYGHAQVLEGVAAFPDRVEDALKYGGDELEVLVAVHAQPLRKRGEAVRDLGNLGCSLERHLTTKLIVVPAQRHAQQADEAAVEDTVLTRQKWDGGGLDAAGSLDEVHVNGSLEIARGDVQESCTRFEVRAVRHDGERVQDTQLGALQDPL